MINLDKACKCKNEREKVRKNNNAKAQDWAKTCTQALRELKCTSISTDVEWIKYWTDACSDPC